MLQQTLGKPLGNTTATFDQANRLTSISLPPTSSTYATTVKADGPVGYWRLGEKSGTTAADATGTGHTGTYGGGPTLGVSGPLAGDGGTAVTFNAANNQQVTTTGGSAFAVKAAFTLEAWINPTGTSNTWQRIISKEVTTPSAAGYSLSFKGGVIAATRTVSGTVNQVVTAATVPAGAWTHVVATYDGTNIRIYLNGPLAVTGASTISMVANTAPLTIGAGSGVPFNGTIAEAAVYNKALTAARIAAHHTTAVVAPRTTAAYSYNGEGLRTSKTVNGAVAANFTWDQNALLLSDATNSYIYGPAGVPVEQIDNIGNATWYHQDQLGTTRALTDPTGTLVGTFTYDANGNQTARTGTVSTPLGYNGQYTDPETGLIYLRARYYDPSTAQFLSVDPLVATTRSAYGYVENNPLNGTDPLGLSPLDCVKKHVAHAIVDVGITLGAGLHRGQVREESGTKSETGTSFGFNIGFSVMFGTGDVTTGHDSSWTLCVVICGTVHDGGGWDVGLGARFALTRNHDTTRDWDCNGITSSCSALRDQHRTAPVATLVSDYQSASGCDSSWQERGRSFV